MARLTISTLGSLEVNLDDQPIAALATGKARALLAYLAVEADRYPGGHPRPHRRETLAGLLWPDYPESSARTNLRNALSNLRKAIGDRDADPPFLLVTRETIQFNAESDCWVDIWAFGELLQESRAESRSLEQAIALYRGPFLQGFWVGDSPAFEDWVLVVRERLERQVLEALQSLTEYDEEHGAYQRACAHARRRVALAPWHERAHQDLMRLLALSGQRGAALAQYEACRRALREELDVEPGEDTQRLYARIRDGELTPPMQEEDVGAISVSHEIKAPPGSSQFLPSPPELPPSSQEVPMPPPPQVQPSVLPPPGPAPLAGERRIATVLIADVKGSTALAGQIDTEDWVEIMDGVFQILGAEIYRYGGEVDQFRGDGLVAFFGLPIAHEDDPERAVLAALAMQSALEEYATELTQREGIDLSLRVGVNTGEVIAATIGERHHREETAMGRAVALAARMETACEPGAVLVTEDTYYLIAPLFEWQALGEIAVKGIRHPVPIYRPLAHRAAPGKGRGIEGLSSPLVGRDAERQALQEALDRLRSGIGGIVTVVGEAGIGKSRLVTEIRKWADRQISKSENYSPRSVAEWDGQVRTSGFANLQISTFADFQWIEGRCLSYATNVAYQLWLDMLRDWLGAAADASGDASPVDVHRSRAEILRVRVRERVWALCADRVGEVYPYLGRMMALPLEEEVETRLRGLDAESLRFLTFHAVETALACGAEERPLVVVCEDLHWADPTSLELLTHLLPLTDRVPLLFVCVFRPEMQHGCWQVKETAARDYLHCHTDLWLRPLSMQESATLVGNLLPQGVDDLPKTLRAHILDHGEGNPFYVEEILRSLIDGGIVVHDEVTERWRATRDVDDIPIPDTLHGVLTARIDRLPEGTKRVLQLASAIGRIFAFPVLASIARTSSPPQSGGHPRGREEGSLLDSHLLAHLMALERAQLIRERARLPEREYAFKHVLTQEAAYSSLLRRERRVNHRRVAEALERLYPERVEEQLGLLAHHWEEAGERERAIQYLRRAGEQAAMQYANEEAIDYLGHALELVPDADADLETRYALLLAREGVCDVQGTREVQRQDLATLEELTQAMDDDGRRAEVAWRKTRYAVHIADHRAAIAAAREAVRLAQAAEHARCEAAAYLYWGWALWRLGDLDAARQQAERALACARAAEWHDERSCSLNRAVEAAALRQLGPISQEDGKPIEAKIHLEQALHICREIGDRRGEGNVLQLLGENHLWLGDYAQARDTLEQALRICREIGDRVQEGWTLDDLGRIWPAEGSYAQSSTYVEQALRIFRETGARTGEAWALVHLGIIRFGLGDYVAARDYCEEALRIRRETGQPESEFVLALGWISHHLGDDQAAREYCRQALEFAESHRARSQAPGSILLGHALAGLGQLTEAADAYRQALGLWQEAGQHHLAPEPLAGLARVALAQEDHTRALAHVGEILGHLEARPGLEGTMEPLRIYLTCYHVLCATNDPRAREVLSTAHRLLHERADKITDEKMRRSFLENVPYHREIAEAWEARNH